MALLQKVQERYPLIYGNICYVASLSLSQTISSREKCNGYFCKLVNKFYEGQWISSKAADLAKKEFDSLLKSAHTELKDTFLTFDQKKGVCRFFLCRNNVIMCNLKSCWEIFKLVFTLSHGQTSVERGFSINKELLVENLHKELIVCEKMVYDHVSSTRNSITKITMTSAMLKSCKLAYSRYATALKEKKGKSDEELKNRNRKLKVVKIAQVKEKKKVLESFIESLNIAIEKCSIAAEKEAGLSLLTKANSFRVSVHSKKESLTALENAKQM